MDLNRRAFLGGLGATFAAWFAVASAAYGATATNPWPANFATVDTHTTTMKEFLSRKSKASTAYASGGMFFAYSSTGSDSKEPADYRAVFGEDYKVNGIVKLSWKGTSGESIVTVTRLSDGDVRTFTTTGTSVEFLAPEIGRNYKWTVRNGGTVSGPWYFYTDGEAPRIIPQSLAVVGNCRDMGGWVTTDGKWRVRQGLGYRNDHNADFATYEQLKPFWTDIAKIRTDMDLRDKANSTQWYCNYELDSNANHSGRSPYGQHWWSVWYWNVLREGDYGAVMNAYKALVDKIGASPASADSKKASANTWKCLADAQYLPVVVHCSQGRDRTGTLAFVLLGALGVGLNDLYADWALTDYAAPKDFPKTTAEEGGSTIVTLYNALVAKYPNGTYPTLQDKCVKLLQDMGVSEAQIANLKSYWLEPVEAKLTAAPGGTSVVVPALSKSRVSKTGSAQKPTVAASSHYTVDYGGGAYTDYGKYLVTVTLKDPTTTKWADGTIGPKVLPFIIEHAGNVVQANVLSFIQGDTSPHIRIARPRYLGEVTCDYTEEQLNALAPGDYTATFTPKACELASASKPFTCKFTVYPSTEKAAYTYEYADLKSAFFKTDYAPTIQTDKIEVRMMDQTDGEGYAPFSSGPYPVSLSIMKMSGGFLRYANGAQRVDNDPGTWTVNKIYKLTAQGKTISHTDEATQKTVTKSISALDAVKPTPGTAYIGCSVDKTANMGAEGTPGYHQPHRLYHVKAWANGTSLIHEFVPCKTTGGYAMLYDKVAKKVYPFSHTCKNTGTVTLGGTATPVGGDDPEPEPTPDTRAVTYTWKGGTAQWAAMASWTPGTGATFGYPNHATYATADFPVTLTEATACTITSGVSVKNALFGSPNLTLTIDNETLTVTGKISDGNYGAYSFGNTATGNPKIVFRGANPGIVATMNDWRSNFGCTTAGASGFCTVRFEVPAANWSQAPIRTGANTPDAYVAFWTNVRFEIDATALGVPSADAPLTVPLATGGSGVRFMNGSLDEAMSRSTVSVAAGAKGTVALNGNTLELTVTADDEPQPEPETEPTPSTRFDAAHTIVCYGDSLTWGASAAEITMDDRANYHDGRLAGVTAVPQGYPYWLSGLIPSTYNVINQSRSGSQTCNITSWSGEQRVDVKRAFTLPAVGSVSVATNFVFNNGPWGEWGGWASTEGQTDKDVFDRWAGFVTPIFPLMEPYDAAKTRYSVTGTLAGRHVRLAGLHPTNITVTVFGEGTAQEIAPGTQFIPDTVEADLYKNAIRIICAGGNDANDKTIEERYATYIRPLLWAFAEKGGRYLIVSPSVNMGTASGTAATAVEQRMAEDFGDHYLNLRQKVVTEGKATAEALGVPFTGKWDATDGTGLKGLNDTVHFSEKGYKVMAEFIRQKLVALGYVEGEVPPSEPPPPVVDPTAYGAADTKAATYTWKGGSGPWNFTTNWTPSASATYGIPNQKTYATADFPATLTESFACTVSNNMTVKFALFDAPNMTLALDNASLTCNDRLDTETWGAFNFGNTATGSPTVEFRGAKAALVTTKYSVRANFGYLGDGDAAGVCTVRFVVPATGWEKTAPIRTGDDSKVIFRPNVRIEINATALGVPNEGVTNRVLLASSTDGMFQNGTTSVTCAKGARGWVAVEGNDLVLSVVAGRSYPSWIGDTDETSKAKYDVWAETYGVSDPSEAKNDAYLLNCANTDAAIEEAKAAFKITGITIGSDGKVTVDTSKADFNGKVEINGARAVDGSYDLPVGSPDARFFKAFLR